MRMLSIVLFSGIVTTWAITAQGAIVAIGENSASAASSATAATYTPGISSSDLIQAGSASLASSVRTPTPYFETATLNDGLGHTVAIARGTYLPATFSGGRLPATYTYNFTDNPDGFGYRIDSITSFAGWNENGSALANQKYELLVRERGSSAFTSLGTYEYSPFNNSNPNAAGATKLTLSDDGGKPLAKEVAAVRFVFQSHGFSNVNASVDGTVYYEVDVFGSEIKNLLVNGSFETPAQSGFANRTGSAIPGWTITGTATQVNGTFGTVAAHGAQWLSLENTGHPQETWQALAKYSIRSPATFTNWFSTIPRWATTA